MQSGRCAEKWRNSTVQPWTAVATTQHLLIITVSLQKKKNKLRLVVTSLFKYAWTLKLLTFLSYCVRLVLHTQESSRSVISVLGRERYTRDLVNAVERSAGEQIGLTDQHVDTLNMRRLQEGLLTITFYKDASWRNKTAARTIASIFLTLAGSKFPSYPRSLREVKVLLLREALPFV